MKAVVLICDKRPDSSGQILDLAGLEPLPTEPVRVSYNFSKDPKDFVGLAKLSLDGNKVMAEITLANPNDCRNSIPVYPAVEGQILGKKPVSLEKADSGAVFQLLTKFKVTALSVGCDRNCDARIEQVKLIDLMFPPMLSKWRHRKLGTRLVIDRDGAMRVVYRQFYAAHRYTEERCTREEWSEYEAKAKRIK
jgi:hypothetical protein